MTSKIGFTCSTFDLFHAGHVLMLKEAKSKCDYLIVGLQSHARPGKSKCYQTVFERYVQVEGCKYVDAIIPYDTEADLLNLLKAIHIDLRIVGEDYKGKDFTGKGLHPVYYNKRQHQFSSSELRKRVIQ